MFNNIINKFDSFLLLGQEDDNLPETRCKECNNYLSLKARNNNTIEINCEQGHKQTFSLEDLLKEFSTNWKLKICSTCYKPKSSNDLFFCHCCKTIICNDENCLKDHKKDHFESLEKLKDLGTKCLKHPKDSKNNYFCKTCNIHLCRKNKK